MLWQNHQQYLHETLAELLEGTRGTTPLTEEACGMFFCDHLPLVASKGMTWAVGSVIQGHINVYCFSKTSVMLALPFFE